MKPEQTIPDTDPTAVSRKKDHIELAFQSQVAGFSLDKRFLYEPALAAHPLPGSLPTLDFLGKTLRTPVWVSSMTGGTGLARTINQNLARACAEFGMGMGLGSCRQLLHSDEYLLDFDVRDLIGPDLPLYANLGIAQLEDLLERKQLNTIANLLRRLRADGLMVHLNPLQEAMQPEGDFFKRPAIDTIAELVANADFPVIVKEVGQGMGPATMRALLQLPLAAIEFAAAGGTNFAKLELLRSSPEKQLIFQKLALVGHTAEEMVEQANRLHTDLGEKVRVPNLIISGGVQDFMDGYYLIKKSKFPAVYGQASGFLKHAREDYESLRRYVSAQVRGLELANAFLTVAAGT
ncbi:MAG: type 2 isopentenyl-diphosphate Delta-isomerase [Lewinellaceae bacterium]|nr:type 2 isopentenyl-diphosphate Delta-isomerase [Lewinellaceae bacterium]